MEKKVNNLKVAIIVPSLANKGPVVVARDLANTMIGMVENVQVFYFDHIPEIEFNCQSRRIGFFERIPFEEFDVVHSHGFRPDLYLSMHRTDALKRVTTMHNNVFEDLTMLKGKLKGWVLAKLWLLIINHDKVATLSNVSNRFYSKQLRRANSRVVTIYNGRKIDAIQPAKGTEIEPERIKELKDKSKIVIGCICGLNKRKGLDQIIRAVNMNSDLSAVFIGDGEELDNLKSLAKQLDVENRISFLGFINRPLVYHQCFDVFVLPSYSEGFPLGVLEAMQIGTPCVVSNLEIYDELFVNTKELFTYELNDIKDLSEKIVIANNQKNTIVANAKKKVSSTYSVDRMTSEYLKLYLSE